MLPPVASRKKARTANASTSRATSQGSRRASPAGTIASMAAPRSLSVLRLAAVALLGPSLELVLVVVIVTTIPGYGRLARTSTLALKNTEFIIAERSLGASTARILFRHTMPNVIGPLLILAAMDVPVVVTIEAGLSFLGLGVLPPTASWGTILNEGYLIIRDTPWPVIAGGVPLVLTTLGFTFLGEALRDVFDPKLRKGH